MKWCVNLKMYKHLVLSELKLKNMSEAYSSLCDLFWIPPQRAKDSKCFHVSDFL